MSQIEIQNSWYVLNQNKKQGPYSYAQMIEFVQKSEILDYQYVWAPHLSEWTVLADVEDFSRDRIIRLIDKKENLPFSDRKTSRVAVKLRIFAHNLHRSFDGVCYSLSGRGGFFLLNEPLLQTGHEVQIAIPMQAGNPSALVLKGQVKTKKYSKTRLNAKSGLHYVVLFTEESQKSFELLKLIQTNLDARESTKKEAA